jgi:hypothetical protein
MTSRDDPDGGDVPTSGPPSDVVAADVANEAGDPACYAHLVCPECGAVTTEGHRAGCGLAAESGASG